MIQYTDLECSPQTRCRVQIHKTIIKIRRAKCRDAHNPVSRSSGRTAWLKFSKRSRILIHCRVSFEFRFWPFVECQMEERSKLLNPSAAVCPQQEAGSHATWMKAAARTLSDVDYAFLSTASGRLQTRRANKLILFPSQIAYKDQQNCLSWLEGGSTAACAHGMNSFERWMTTCRESAQEIKIEMQFLGTRLSVVVFDCKFATMQITGINMYLALSVLAPNGIVCST